MVNGDHDTIVQGKKHADTVRIINAIINNEPIPNVTSA